ncbi:unnamed protein product [Phytophthora fragariaefolia]|uniref:Unnamed protein product n=1 Tax=Phytophthora fragariaefolia TaxID=1490495 RepID=A0A9W6TU95_9STRA|nr:unnamed protein product [Phytophthora fragariaefolia]
MSSTLRRITTTLVNSPACKAWPISSKDISSSSNRAADEGTASRLASPSTFPVTALTIVWSALARHTVHFSCDCRRQAFRSEHPASLPPSSQRVSLSDSGVVLTTSATKCSGAVVACVRGRRRLTESSYKSVISLSTDSQSLRP